MSIIVSILIFGLIVLVHEFGHYIVAVKRGVLVEEFAIGMGPKIFGFEKGDTLYSIRLLPFGGYCKMLGENEEINDPRAFVNKKVTARILIITAGVVMNFILAFVLQFVVTLYVPIETTMVRDVVIDSPADKIGLKSGDTITTFKGKKYSNFNELRFAILMSKSKEAQVGILKKDGTQIIKNVELAKNQDGYYSLGFYYGQKETYLNKVYYGEYYEEFLKTVTSKASFVDHITYSVRQVFFYIKTVFYSIAELVGGRFTMDDMSGPVGIVGVIGETYEESIKEGSLVAIINILNLIILLSANIGVMNLLPLPALDGGRLIFLLIELLRGKPVDQEKEGMVHFVGIVLLMIFAVFIAYKDIIKLITK